MTTSAQHSLRVAVACGGTGGHLFPGLAVAECLLRRGCEVSLLISPKEVDQKAVRNLTGMQVVTLPAIGLTRGQRIAFVRAFWQSYRTAHKHFATNAPHAVLAMGGFTAAAPLLAGKRAGAATFLHESNTIPGRANRWVARLVNGAFVGFPAAAPRLASRNVAVTGTPVRAQFLSLDTGNCRRELGLDASRPVGLVMGGSQGAHGINALLQASLPALARQLPAWQWVHLTGPADLEPVREAYAAANIRAIVEPFLCEMETAMGAATIAVSRAGASSLAELAAVKLPSILVPYPAATDNHQYYNARAFEETGAALLLDQQRANPEALIYMFKALAVGSGARQQMQNALARWHTPDAAERIAARMLEVMTAPAADVASHAKTNQNRGDAGGPANRRSEINPSVAC